MTWLRPIGGSLVPIQSTHSRFGLWTVRLFIGGDVENVLDVWNLLRKRMTRKMSENERRRRLREASKTPTATVMEWWTLVALLEENCHTRGGQVLHQSPVEKSCGPMSPGLGCWSITHVWKVGQQVLEGPKDETKSTKYKKILENALTQTERRTCLC